jgi:GDP-4-dehydro-6-deoxy-D-mannose reductase
LTTTQNLHLITSLITGINGFVGKYLAHDLVSRGRRVFGIDIQNDCSLSNIGYFNTDICDVGSLSRILKETQPLEIYHLAGISYPPQFNSDQFTCFHINLLGAVALLDAIKSNCPQAKVLMVGSSKQYENQTNCTPISEQTPLAPNTFYGISKYFSEMIGRRYAQTYHLDIRYTRSFNHTGPGQSSQFVCSDWAHQLALINSQKASPELSVGNINEIIDFSDVRDIVEAYRLILEKGKNSEAYNVCSGKGISLKYIIEYLTTKSSLAVSVLQRQNKIEDHVTRREIIGDNRKIFKDTGWSPKISIEKTLDDLYSWWLDEIKNSR